MRLPSRTIACLFRSSGFLATRCFPAESFRDACKPNLSYAGAVKSDNKQKNRFAITLSLQIISVMLIIGSEKALINQDLF